MEQKIVGRYFEHRNFIDARGIERRERIPQLFKVTRVARGGVYYRMAESTIADGRIAVSLGGGHWSNLEDFESKRVLAWTSPAEYLERHGLA